jgi:hypothetical protein
MGAIAATAIRVHLACMRSLLLLLLGATSGLVGAVLLFTIADTFDTEGPERTGGGNARVELDESALTSLFERQASQFVPADTPVAVTVLVGDDGLIEVRFLIGEVAVSVESVIVLNPELVEGELEFVVESSDLHEMPPDDQLAGFLTRPLYVQLDALAGNTAYRLTSITTIGGTLTLEIET